MSESYVSLLNKERNCVSVSSLARSLRYDTSTGYYKQVAETMTEWAGSCYLTNQKQP